MSGGGFFLNKLVILFLGFANFTLLVPSYLATAYCHGNTNVNE